MGQRNRIGETLRSARERTGLTVEQAAADAGIPAQYVRLLEGESEVRIGIADELYLIPFFRRYAAFLNLDTTELLPEFVSVVQDMAGEGSPPLQLAYRSRWRRVWRPAAIVATIAAAAAVVLLRNPEGPPPVHDAAGDAPLAEPTPVRLAAAAETASALATPAVDAPASAAPSAPSATSTPAPAATVAESVAAPATSPSPAPPDATVLPTVSRAEDASTAARELRIEAAEETWISIGVDDEPRRSVMLKAGETRTWTGTTGFALTIGNAGGITVSLDGQPLPALGRSGQVVRVQLPRDHPADPGNAR